MTGLFTQLLSWKALLVAIAVFGFAPRAVLRFIILAFPRSDARRRELLSELHTVPRWERPLWIAEQLEVAIADGLALRLARAWRRLAPGQRAARWLRREREDWAARPRYTNGYALSAASFWARFVYTGLFIPAPAKWVLLVAEAVTGTIAARRHEQARKTLAPGEPLAATRLDRWIFIVAGPASYAATAYMLVHNLIRLSTGNMSAGYWVGTYLCVLVLAAPWELLRASRQAARIAAQGGPAGHPGS